MPVRWHWCILSGQRWYCHTLCAQRPLITLAGKRSADGVWLKANLVYSPLAVLKMLLLNEGADTSWCYLGFFVLFVSLCFGWLVGFW